MKKIFLIFVLLVLASVSFAQYYEIESSDLYTKLKILHDGSAENFDLILNETEYLSILSVPEGLSEYDVEWSSSDTDVVTVDNGYLRAVGYGSATVKATYGNISDSIVITVPEFRIARKVYAGPTKKFYRFDYEDFELRSTENLYAVGENRNTLNVMWTSSNINAVTVDSNGLVEAVGFGTAIITAKLPNGSKDTIKVTVVPITEINIERLDNLFFEFYLDTEGFEFIGTENLRVVYVNGGSVYEKLVKWTSSNEKSVKFTSPGVIEAVKGGKSVITATLPNGVSDSITVTVPNANKINISRWSLDYDYNFNDFELFDYEELSVRDIKGNYINDINWKSSNKKAVTVDKNGTVKAVGFGVATITAELKSDPSVKDTVKISVPEPVKINIFRNDCTSSNCVKRFGDFTTEYTENLFVIDNNDNYIGNSLLTWKSSASNIVSVDKYGCITPVGYGTAVITATLLNGVSDYIKVTVPGGQSVTKIVLNKKELSVAKGNTETLKATVSPSNATYKTVTWKSSNTKIATVDKNGNVKGIKDGKVTITAITDGTDKKGKKLTATCDVTVYIAVKSIKLSKTSIVLEKGKSATLKATVSPSNATNKTVTWKSGNTKIVTVDKNGKIKGIKKGTATVYAVTDGTDKNGKKIKVSCEVTVKDPVVKVKSVKLNKSSLTLKKGNSATLKATVSPSNATDKSGTWKSSNTKVATVDKNGKVKAIKAGTATITFTTKDGNKKVSCKIMVK